MIHNIPMHYTTKGLFSGKVLKFDIKRPTKDERLWNKHIEKTISHTQECIIETHSEINKTEQNKTDKEEQDKMQRKRKSDQINRQDPKEKKRKTDQKQRDQSTGNETKRNKKTKTRKG